MIEALMAGFIGGLIGAGLLTRFQTQGLKSSKERSILGTMAAPGRAQVKKRAPKVITDLIEYEKEIQNEGENRG